ncbi:hypothetical protein [Halomonas caseinilytica]|uniref:Uncharacterized protein n=1 Tax=Halomonas caseinilytica TaxID=438744 RepID=A0A1M6PI17_9GAMM|nr:hypothetical protein [Halomonas caseinilytica]SEM19299.1 hypothetical protein SAMN04487952_10270 [Halomonas caseinilytica]SHK07579.1 hypothetical protein SAMN05192556_101743 [Halomonas caseinilytica]
MDEREKLRKFRELDDAFAQALRELEQPDNTLDIPTGPPVRSLAALDEEERQKEREAMFEHRLKTLMQDYAQPAESVSHLLETLKALGKIA